MAVFGRTGLLVLALLAGVPAAAPAATLHGEDRPDRNPRGEFVGTSRYITFSGSGAERNELTVAQDGGELVFADGSATIAATGLCRSVDEHTARCPLANGVVSTDLGDGDDTLVIAESVRVYMEPSGGSGDDILTTAATTALFGDAGNDVLTGSSHDNYLGGGPGDDHLRGGGGNDYLTGDDAYIGAASPRGRDELDGGAGIDTANYSGHRVPLSIDLTRRGGQGAKGENDSLEGIESLRGGSAPDDMRGDGGRNYIASYDEHASGGRGRGDMILGRGGDDLLAGSDADDRISGGDGADELRTGRGRDRVSAGAGDDRVELGNDERTSVPAASIGCGPGADVVSRSGARNVIRRDCEQVEISFGAVRPPGIRAFSTRADVPVSIRAEPFATSYPPPCGVRVDLAARIDGRRRKLGTGASGLPGDGTVQVVRVALNSLGRRLIARPGRARVLVTGRTHHGCNPGEVRSRNHPGTFAIDL